MELKSVDVKVTNPRLFELGGLPKRATDGSAGYDVAACIERQVMMFPGQTHTFELGFSVAIKDPRWGLFFLPRSGLGINAGIILSNSIGLIDSDYRGGLKLSLWNRNPAGNEPFTIGPGDRVGQMLFLPIGLPDLNLVEEFEDETARGTGGLGSTGLGRLTV